MDDADFYLILFSLIAGLSLLGLLINLIKGV